MNRKDLIENLVAMGGKKGKHGIQYIANQLVIRHKKSGVEYTVKKVSLEGPDGPCVICYRYYSPKEGGKKVFVKILPQEFKEYEPV